MYITINGLRPLALSKRDAAIALGNKPTLLARMIWCARNQPTDPWVVLASNHDGNPGEEVTLDTESVERAYARLLSGEEPPLLPAERRGRKHKTFRDLLVAGRNNNNGKEVIIQ